MALVDVTNVARCKLDGQALRGFHLDAPARGLPGDAYTLSFSGWVLGKKAPVVALEWAFPGAKQCRVPVNLPRPDIAKLFPHVEGAGTSGFRNFLSLLGVPLNFEATVCAVLQDDTRVELAQVRGRRDRLVSGCRPRLRPLLLTTLGRSGSTWVVCLLAAAPQVVAYRPFQFEPRVATYWMDVLRALAEPASYLQAVVPELYGEDWWLGTKRSSPIDATQIDPDIFGILGRSNPEKSAAFCQDRIDQLYRQVATLQCQTEARYFLEKFQPKPAVVSNLILELYPEAREIVLIRDLRDIACSILAFTKKRADAYFYRELGNNEQAIIGAMKKDAKFLLDLWQQREQTAYLLRYEDLIRRPEESLRGVLHYLGLEVDSAGIAGMLKQAAEKLPEVQRQHQTSQNPQDSIGRWRRDLSPALQNLCRDEFGELLTAFGYDVA
jgi:hypothetical protein